MIILAGFMSITVVAVAFTALYDALAARYGWEDEA